MNVILDVQFQRAKQCILSCWNAVMAHLKTHTCFQPPFCCVSLGRSSLPRLHDSHMLLSIKQIVDVWYVLGIQFLGPVKDTRLSRRTPLCLVFTLMFILGAVRPPLASFVRAFFSSLSFLARSSCSCPSTSTVPSPSAPSNPFWEAPSRRADVVHAS